MPLPQQFRRLRLPVIGSPMFIVSSLDLVEAQCRAGVLGTFPALNARPQEELAVWLEELQRRLEGTHGLYGVNLICHASNDRLAGAAGSYGCNALGEAARGAEQALAQTPGQDSAAFSVALRRLEQQVMQHIDTV